MIYDSQDAPGILEDSDIAEMSTVALMFSSSILMNSLQNKGQAGRATTLRIKVSAQPRYLSSSLLEELHLPITT